MDDEIYTAHDTADFGATGGSVQNRAPQRSWRSLKPAGLYTIARTNQRIGLQFEASRGLCLRRLPTAGQRRLDRPHVRTGIQRLDGKNIPSLPGRRSTASASRVFRRRVGISPAGERIIAPVDRSRCNQIPPDALAGRPNVSASETSPMSLSSASVSDDMPSTLGPREPAGRPSSSRETTCA